MNHGRIHQTVRRDPRGSARGACRRRVLSLAAWTIVAIAAVPTGTHAQTPPDTEIFLVELEADGSPLPASIVNITRREGYDNQPAFTSDGESILYTSRREDQTDIYRYSLSDRSTRRVTRTSESEYSPTPLPAGTGFSVVRVEPDSTQRLWRFSSNGTNPGLLLPDIEPVGYHAWVDEGTVALFVLAQPPTLRIARLLDGGSELHAQGIGRSLHAVPGRRAISFVSKRDETDWWIEILDLETREIVPLAPTMEGAEDYVWTTDGTILMGSGSSLYALRSGASGWHPVADFAGAGLDQITRLAVSPDGRRLAVVALQISR